MGKAAHVILLTQCWLCFRHLSYCQQLHLVIKSVMTRTAFALIMHSMNKTEWFFFFYHCELETVKESMSHPQNRAVPAAWCFPCEWEGLWVMWWGPAWPQHCSAPRLCARFNEDVGGGRLCASGGTALWHDAVWSTGCRFSLFPNKNQSCEGRLMHHITFWNFWLFYSFFGDQH